MAGQLAGKVGLVTGGASGIGRATALAFAREGAKVVVADISIKGGEETVRMVQKAGVQAMFVETDVRREADAEALVKKTVDRYGRLDCAVNNAGIAGDAALTADFSTQSWEMVIAINLTGVFLGMKYQIPQMLKQGGGSIVNVASTHALVAHGLNPAYVTSKHGVLGLTKSTALGYANSNIRVNAVCPGNTRTGITEPFIKQSPEIYQGMIAATPVGRLAEPNEIAEGIIWLCSDAASYCNGAALVIDGGYTIQ